MKVITREIYRDKIPKKWDDVTFRQYINLAKASDDYIKVLSLFLNIEYDTLKKAKVENFDLVVASLSFMKEQPAWQEYPVTLAGIKMPKDITWETIEQFEEMRKVILNHDINDALAQIEQYRHIVSIYYQPLKDGSDYDSEKAQYLLDSIDNMSCIEVISLGRFFFAKLISSINNIPNSFLKQTIRPKSRMQVFLTLTKRLGSTALFKRLRKGTYSSSVRY